MDPYNISCDEDLAIPKNIRREHVLMAISEIDRNGVRKGRESRTWFLEYNGKTYPPKYVISLANKYANGAPLNPLSFTAQEAVTYLRKLGFHILKSASETTSGSGEYGVMSVKLFPDYIREWRVGIKFFNPSIFDKRMYMVFEAFASLLIERFRTIIDGESYLKGIYQESEDTIRYMLFYTLTMIGRVDPIDIYLEYPHEDLPGKEYAKLDTFIAPRGQRQALAFEIKFKIKPPSIMSLPKPDIAGSAFVDILRLAVFKPSEEIKRYFIYIVDNEMITYYNNPANRLYEFFNLELNTGFKLTREYLLSRPETMKKRIYQNLGKPSKWPEPIIICRYKNDLKIRNNTIAIRIYEVKP